MEHDPSILEDLLSPAGWDHCSRCSVRDLHEFLEEFDAYASASLWFWMEKTGFVPCVFSPKCDCLVWDAMSPCLPRLARLFLLSPVASPIKKSQLVWDAVSALWGLLTEPSTGNAMSYSLITARVLSVRQGENQKSVANSMSNIPTAVWGLRLKFDHRSDWSQTLWALFLDCSTRCSALQSTQAMKRPFNHFVVSFEMSWRSPSEVAGIVRPWVSVFYALVGRSWGEGIDVPERKIL